MPLKVQLFLNAIKDAIEEDFLYLPNIPCQQKNRSTTIQHITHLTVYVTKRPTVISNHTTSVHQNDIMFNQVIHGLKFSQSHHEIKNAPFL